MFAYPFCPQPFTDSPTQQPQRNPIKINAFRTLFTMTEGISPLFPFRNSSPSLITIIQALFSHVFTKCKFHNSFVLILMQIGGGVYPPPLRSLPMNSTWEARVSLLHYVTSRVFRASQVQTGCWPPICFFWSPTGTQRNWTTPLRACPCPFPGRKFQISSQLAKSVECPLPLRASVE